MGPGDSIVPVTLGGVSAVATDEQKGGDTDHRHSTKN